MNDKQAKQGNEGKPGSQAENSAPGLNDNLQFMGRQLHIQTERIGHPTPHIVTQVFSNGRVVFSKKYELPSQSLELWEFQKIQELMRTQHLQTIREIKEKQKRVLAKPACS